MSAVPDRFDIVVLMGPPGTGKSYLGNRLRERGVASYLEIEPLIVAKFGSDLESQAAEVGAYLWDSYKQQLKDAEGLVAAANRHGIVIVGLEKSVPSRTSESETES